MIRQGGAPRFPIKLALITGTLLAALTTAALIFLSLRPDRDYLPVPQDPFHRLLREYDLVADSPPDPAQLDAQISLLDRMERSAQGVESWLSLLKRRRALAGTSLRMLLLYQASSRRAAAVFPWSEPLAAVAAAALLQGTAPGATAEAAASAEDTDAHRTAQSAAQAANRAELRAYAALIKETSLCPLALGVSILIGDLASPDRLPAQEALLSAALPLVRPGMPRDQGDRLIANLAILRLLKGDYRGAEAQILGIARSENPELRNFLGEYYYDFGDPLQAAVMFNRVGDERALIRSADALWLGGKTESAGTIWRALNGQSGTNPVEPALRLRSLYNLAAGAPDTAERNKWLSLLIAGGQENPGLAWEPAYLYGLTAYTRTLDPYEALALLDIPETGPEPAMAALRDLEILRRRGELWPLDRTLAETWLLLGRYPQDSRLYQWAAWYFSHQRRYEEVDILIKTAGYRDIRGPWLELTAALRDMETGSLDQAEERLRAMTEVPANRAIWQAAANLGLILESRHAPFPALEYYEIAAARLPASLLPATQDRRAASRLQLRIAGCLRTLGRTEDSRRALRYSLDLNPDNLAARLELRRLEDQ